MTLEALTKRIKTTTDLRDIVSTMKMLSSVSIAPYEKALKSLDEYGQTVQDAFSALLKDEYFYYTPRPSPIKPKTIAVIIGTDNGLVGRFNRDVLAFARRDLAESNLLSDSCIICIGKRLGLVAESAKLPIRATFPIMNSLKEIATVSGMILTTINDLIATDKSDQVFIYHTRKKPGEPQQVQRLQLMPLPPEHLSHLKKRTWDGHTPPMVTGDRNILFNALIHEYLGLVLSMSLTASLAAEHYTRMVHMQQAEKNIDASLEDMNLSYQQLRQTGITDELIDIVSGAESLRKKKY